MIRNNKKNLSEINNNKPNYLFKILILGDQSVGKTSVLLRYFNDIYNFSQTATIGVDYKIKTIDYKSKKIKLNIWDTAGQDRFKSLTQSYYKGSHGIILIYDITDITSFNNVKQWMYYIKDNAPKDVTLILCGNKKDDEDNREVSYEESKTYAESIDIPLIEISAKEDLNVNEVFEMLYCKIYDKIELSNSNNSNVPKGRRLLTDTQNNSSNSKCCK